MTRVYQSHPFTIHESMLTPDNGENLRGAVATAAEQEQGQVQAHHQLHAGPHAGRGEVEGAQGVRGQRVGPAQQHHRLRLEALGDGLQGAGEDPQKGLVSAACVWGPP